MKTPRQRAYEYDANTGACDHHMSTLDCMECLTKVIEDACADACAAGYAEAIEKAAKVMESYGFKCRMEVVDAVRALAPAATTEEPK